jgi:hypothetical protein
MKIELIKKYLNTSVYYRKLIKRTASEMLMVHSTFLVDTNTNFAIEDVMNKISSVGSFSHVYNLKNDTIKNKPLGDFPAEHVVRYNISDNRRCSLDKISFDDPFFKYFYYRKNKPAFIRGFKSEMEYKIKCFVYEQQSNEKKKKMRRSEKPSKFTYYSDGQIKNVQYIKKVMKESTRIGLFPRSYRNRKDGPSYVSYDKNTQRVNITMFGFLLLSGEHSGDITSIKKYKQYLKREFTRKKIKNQLKN